jgi:predicted secreted protein
MKNLLLLLSLTLFTTLANAREHRGHALHDRVNLAVSATDDIANDLTIAVLYVEREGQNQSKVAAEINETMAWALAEAKAVKGLKLQTQQYSTYPVYGQDSTVISGWRARQSLRLESADAATLGELMSRLQARLAVESVGFGVSRAKRETVEASLTSEALARFQTRATRIAKDLGRPGYRIMQLDVSGTGGMPGPVHYPRMMAMAEGAMAAARAPAQMETGEQAMTVTVTGTIQLEGEEQ